MTAIDGLNLPPTERGLGRGSAVTVGMFDGVHRGHLRLIDALRSRARSSDLRSVVVTFRQHPLSVLRPDFQPKYLSTFDRRVALLEQTGVDAVVAVDFDEATADLPAADFVEQMCRGLEMKQLVVGPDFALGRGREGDVHFLADMGAAAGFGVEVVEALTEAGQRVGSTAVREALSRGDVETAGVLLGRGFTLTGQVVKGRGRGGPLGFPTANLLSPDGLAVPGDGIYATWAYIEGQGARIAEQGGAGGGERLMSATSIGTRPTFDETDRTVEAFVLDYSGDLYGKELTLEFVRRLRDEERFDSEQALQRQVEKDVTVTRAILSGEDGRK